MVDEPTDSPPEEPSPKSVEGPQEYVAATADEISAIVRRARELATVMNREKREQERATEVRSFGRSQQLRDDDLEMQIQLRRRYAVWLLGAMMTQLVLANVTFFLYAWLGQGWDVEPVVMDAWLASTVVQVIGTVTVVVKHLFPKQ